jgi:hypothetical protein
MQPAALEPGKQRVSVIVVDLTSGAPLQGVRVTLYLWKRNSEDVAKWSALTDDQGFCEIEFGVEEGQKHDPWLAASHDGWWSDHIDFRHVRDISAEKPYELRLEPYTWVNVKLVGGTGVPRSGWLVPGFANDGSPKALFDPVDRCARIEVLYSQMPKGPYRARALWFGHLIESKPFEIQWGQLNEIALQTPKGATLEVSVVGPDGEPMPDVQVGVMSEIRLDHTLLATNSAGKARFEGIPPGQEVTVSLEPSAGAAFCNATKAVLIRRMNDSVSLVFDFTGCGRVQSKLSAENSPMTDLWVYEGETLMGRVAVEGPQTVIHGLLPGRYRVSASGSRNNFGVMQHRAEFDVLPVSELSVWEKDFDGDFVEVHVNVGAGDEDLRLWVWENGSYRPSWRQPVEPGSFRVATGGAPILVQATGPGSASAIVRVDPAQSRSMQLDLLECGFIVLNERQGSVSVWPSIEGIEPEQPEFAISLGKPFNLVPGRYRVSPKDGMWPAQEFEIKSGKETALAIGTEIRCTVEIWSKQYDIYDRFDYQLVSNGQAVTFNKNSRRSDGPHAAGYLEFAVEGRLTLRITREGFEPFEAEFEASRDKPARVDVEFKRRSD